MAEVAIRIVEEVVCSGITEEVFIVWLSTLGYIELIEEMNGRISVRLSKDMDMYLERKEGELVVIFNHCKDSKVVADGVTVIYGYMVKLSFVGSGSV